jgi:hypothetical protein
MLLDVEGRTDMIPRGKSRKSETPSNNPGNRLEFSALGLAPADTHHGVAAREVLGHSKKHASAPEAAPEKRTGKRSVDVVHGPTDLEAAKRLAGKYGLKKVPTATHQPVRDRQRAGATAAETSEQRAVKLLRKAASQDPSIAPEVGKAIEKGGVALLDAEKNYRRRLECEARANYQQAARDAMKPRRFADPENLSHIPAPFGNNVEGVSNIVKHVPHRRPLTGPQSAEEQPHGKKQIPSAFGSSSATSDVPYDTVHSGAPYPAPPPCGVRVPLGGGKPSKRMLNAPTDGRDHDSISMERARSKGSREAPQMPDFIFGNPRGPKVRMASSPIRHHPVGPTLLEHDVKAPPPAQPRSKFAEVKYKKTTLW